MRKKWLIALLLFIPSLAFGHDVTLTWTASVTPNVAYLVLRGTATGVETLTLTASPVASNCSGATCTYDDTSNLVEGTTYYYVIEAVDLTDATNISVPSAETSAKIPKTKPAAPTAPKSVAK